VGRKEPNNLIVERGVTVARRSHKRRATLDRMRQCPFEDFPDSSPVFGTL
jgi:hypothetical protein